MKKNITYSFLDQALVSLTNFFIGIAFIKLSTKEQYGLYSVYFTIILLLLGFQNAIVNTQIVVRAPKKSSIERNSFISGLHNGQYLIFLPLVFIACVISWIIYPRDQEVALAILVISVASIGILSREFTRNYLYFLLSPGKVLIGDILYALILFVFTFLLFISSKFNAVTVVVGVGIASAISGIIMLSVSSFSVKIRMDSTFTSLKEAWEDGRWALVGVTVTWLQSYSFVYLSAMFSGPDTTAELNAARIILTPLITLNTSIFVVLKPHWSYWHADGDFHKIRASSIKLLGIIFSVILVYAVFIFVIEDVLISFLYSSQYSRIGELVVLWSIFMAIQIARTSYSIQLQIFSKFKYIASVNTVTSLVTVLLGILLMTKYELTGSLIAMILSEIILTILFWRRIRHEFEAVNS
jgi:O-antigen/teichoic acid export membrane protein